MKKRRQEQAVWGIYLTSLQLGGEVRLLARIRQARRRNWTTDNPMDARVFPSREEAEAWISKNLNNRAYRRCAAVVSTIDLPEVARQLLRKRLLDSVIDSQRGWEEDQ